jgi:hypothetical protein
MASIHHVNHPGKEIIISYYNRNTHRNDYYFLQNSITKGIRLWNSGEKVCNNKEDCDSSHKRKFIEFNGKYISDLNKLNEKEALLRFWGEYEGYSEFELLNKQVNVPNYNNPCAVHKPFFHNINMGQNTDPFIFGDKFYYTICKKVNLTNIQTGDLILFGSEFGKNGSVKFYLDTLFIVKDEINVNTGVFDEIYIESTLNRLYNINEEIIERPVHTGLKFQDVNKKSNPVFSFVPCMLSNHQNIGFGRPWIDTTKYNDYLKKPGARTGVKSSEIKSKDTIECFWKQIAEEVLNQGFLLGTHFDNLPIFKTLPKN